jgi:trehalose-6-phosphatase
MKVSSVNTPSRVNFVATNPNKHQQTTAKQNQLSENHKILTGVESGAYFKADILLNRPSFGKRLISQLPTATFDNVMKTLGNKKPLIVFDYDGTFAPFVADTLKASPQGGADNFIKVLKKLEAGNIPVFIVTSRTIRDFLNPGVIGPEAKNINRIGLKGNQMNLILPENIASLFTQKYSSKAGYEVFEEALEDGKKRVKIKPKAIPGFKESKSELEEAVKKISDKFGIEEKEIMYTLHWRKLEESKNDKNSEFVDEQIQRGIKAFEKICKEKFKNEFDSGQFHLHLDESNMIYELVDKRTDLEHNKGSIIEELSELYNDKPPIFLGDSVGPTSHESVLKDDEYAMEAVKKYKGIGIAVIARDTKEVSEFDKTAKNRGKIKTASTHKINSYEDTISLLEKLSKHFEQPS